MTTTIRPVRSAAETQAAASLYLGYLLDEVGAPVNPRWHWDLLDPAATYLPGDDPTGSALLVALDDHGEVVGCVALRRTPTPAGAPEWYARRFPAPLEALELARLCVRPDMRRQGLARRLVDAAVEHAADMVQPGALHLHAHTSTPAALGFWRASDAREVTAPTGHDTSRELPDTAWFELDVHPLAHDDARRWYDDWEAIQTRYVPGREEGFTLIGDLVTELVGTPRRILDLGAGPGCLGARLGERFGCEVVAVELDPMLVQLGRDVHGDRIRYVERDLRVDGWADDLGPADVAVSATALHYLLPEQFDTVAKGLGHALVPGGLFLDLDTIPVGDTRLADVLERRRRQEWEDAFGEGVQTWDAWWEGLRQLPGMEDRFQERERRFGERVAHRPTSLPQIREALMGAGFDSVEVAQARWDKQLLVARRES